MDNIAGSISAVATTYALRARRARYRTDPALWTKDRLNIDLWSMQRNICDSIVNNKKTVVKSCHDSGKTYLAAILVCWWIDVHPPLSTMVISTAPTAYQVNKLLWEYVRALHRVHGLSGTVSEASEWKSDTRDVVGMGRKPADTNIHGFQGIHRQFVLAIIDEACGVPEQIWTGVEAITTNPENRVLAIGNPDDPATEFGRIFRDNDPSWAQFTISAFDTPNFTDEWQRFPKNVAELFLEKRWVEEKARSWGEESARYRAKVLAEFPTASLNTFFTPTDIQLGLTNTAELLKTQPADDPGVLGVDIARFGADDTVVIHNRGGVLTIVGHWSMTDTVDTAHKVHQLAVQLGVREVRLDATGIGVGVVDNLTRLCSTFYLVIEMVGSAASPDPRRWYNFRAYIYDYMREGLRNGTIGLPEWHDKESGEKQLTEELEALQYRIMPQQASIVMESKQDMKNRGLKSPDFADTAVYACAPIDLSDPGFGQTPGDVDYYDALEEGWNDELNGLIAPSF